MEAAEEKKVKANRDRMTDGLLAVRADAQNLLEAVGKVEDACALDNPEARQLQVAQAVAHGLELLERRQLVEHWKKINAAREQEPSLGAERGDQLEVVLNAIEDLRGSWPTNVDPGQALAQANATRTVLSRLVQAAAELTIPSRLKEHLRERSTGRPLNFNAVFTDEMPDPVARKAFLAELKDYEGRSFDGVVDVDAGLVYVTSASRPKRILSYFAPAITAVALGGLLYGVSALSIDWALKDSQPLIQGYILVLLGMVAHLLVENAKQFDMGDKVVVVGDKLTWMHLHWVALSWSIVPAAITAVGLRFGKVPGADEWATFLFAGYSADSVAGLFLTRYDAAAKKGFQALKAALSPAKS